MTWVHLITSLEGGGTENFLYQILSRSPAGHQHRVFFLGKNGVIGERIRALGIPVERTTPAAFYAFLRREKPEVLHTCLYWANQLGRLAGWMAHVPLIVSSHRSIDVWQNPWHGTLDRWTLRHCDAILANSDAARRVLEDRLEKCRARPPIFKVENSVDFPLFKPRDRAQAKQRYGLPPDAIVGGSLMRLHAEKGAEKIPAFAKAVLEKHPKLYLIVGGNGPLESALKKDTQLWGERVKWVGWQDDAAAFLSALDFFWLLSREESFSQALLEASAIGLAWLAPDVGGVPELLEAGAAGLLYRAGDVANAAHKAGELLSQIEAYNVRARDVVTRLAKRFDLSTMANTFYTIVESQRRRS